MDDDSLTNTLLTEYESTAELLQKGVNVSAETMNKYHGMTGRLLAATMRNLWSQQELEEQIDKRVQKKCETCNRVTVDGTWGEIIKRKASLLIVCVTVIVSLAIVCNRVDDLRSLFGYFGDSVTQVK